MGQSGLVDLEGSHRSPLTGARRVGDAPAEEEVLLTLVLRRRPQAELPRDLAGESRATARERLAEAAGADPADIDRVTRYLESAGMHVVGTDPASRSMSVRTTVQRANAAFGVQLGRYEAQDLSYRGREGAVQLPPEVADAVEAVLGLDDRPQARVHLRRGPVLAEEHLPSPTEQPMTLTAAGAPQPKPMWTTQVMGLYDFPADLDGSDQTIAIIELGGGYRDAELAAYFTRAGVPQPQVTAVAVDKGRNHPGEDADGEVLLDIEVAGTVAPRAKIVVYFADNSDRGFFDAVNRAIHDTEHAPAAVSISWGGPESAWTPQAMNVFDSAMADAGALGVTILAAAGDHGAGDAAGDGQVHADFPASSPHVVACGGTELIAAAGGGIASEAVWNEADGWATGGGVSRQFGVPDYQQGITIPANLDGSGQAGRGVPDVAGNAAGGSGYIVRVDGQWTSVGGTSAVAPLYAGLVALLDQGLGRPVGLLLTDLYAAGGDAGIFGDIEGGDNGTPETQDFGPATPGYPATAGWDACTGLGSLRGSALLARLREGAAQTSAA
jgi:kumamolisin